MNKDLNFCSLTGLQRVFQASPQEDLQYMDQVEICIVVLVYIAKSLVFFLCCECDECKVNAF